MSKAPATGKKSAPRKPRVTGVKPAAARPAAGPTVQQSFLDELIKTNTRVTIFLVNGVKLEGEIRSYDRYVILMKNAVTDKVYKHAVSTIMPMTGAATAQAMIEKRGGRSGRGGHDFGGRLR